MRYEYKVIPAPERGEKARGAKGAEGRFAAAVERIMNDLALRGWEYMRSDTLPSEERSGLTQTQVVWRNLLVFRRPAASDAEAFQPKMLAAPPTAEPTKPLRTQDRTEAANMAEPQPSNLFGSEEDNEENSIISGLPGALRARAQKMNKA